MCAGSLIAKTSSISQSPPDNEFETDTFETVNTWRGHTAVRRRVTSSRGTLRRRCALARGWCATAGRPHGAWFRAVCWPNHLAHELTSEDLGRCLDARAHRAEDAVSRPKRRAAQVKTLDICAGTGPAVKKLRRNHRETIRRAHACACISAHRKRRGNLLVNDLLGDSREDGFCSVEEASRVHFLSFEVGRIR